MRAKQFNERRYQSFAEFWSALRLLFSDFKNIKRVRLISPAFRERLMIAVTAVYGCSYCSWFHTALALRTGIHQEEIIRLLSNSVENCPEDEAIALIYAQHWADFNAEPQPESTQRLLDTYGREKAEAINLLLRMDRIGNLFGNSFDYLLYKISSGRWGRYNSP